MTKQELELQAKKKRQEYLDILEQIKELGNKNKYQILMSASFDIFKTLFNNKILQKLNIGNSHSGETIHGAYTSQNSILQSNNNRTNKLLFVSYGNIRDINGKNDYYKYKTEPVEITDFYFEYHIGDTSDINKSSLRFGKFFTGVYVNASYRPMINYLN